MEVGAATCGVALLAAGLGEYRESVVLRDGLLALVAVPVSVCALGRKTTGRLWSPGGARPARRPPTDGLSGLTRWPFGYETPPFARISTRDTSVGPAAASTSM